MSASTPRVYSIAPGVSFVDALAEGLLAERDDDPLAFADSLVLLPNRRACRALQDAFLRATDGAALILPRLIPLGDLDVEDQLDFLAPPSDLALGEEDIPPAIPALRRHLLLTRLVLQWSRAQARASGGQAYSEDRAARLAQELARLLDQMQTEGIALDRLAGLVPEAYAAHWQITLAFLAIVTEQWPAILEEQGTIDPAERRVRMLSLQAELWRRAPPDVPVVVAGSTGSVPASAELIATVARLPRGRVVLPGLDPEAGPDDWEAVAEDQGHPQHGLARLLQRIGVAPADVAAWPLSGAGSAPGSAPGDGASLRSRLVNRALQPAARPFEWHHGAPPQEAAALSAVLENVTRIDCANPLEEALVVALVMRRELETAGRRIALVTPDRGLARRVAGELERWGVTVDDSAGTPLGDTPPGAFLRLTAEMVAQRAAPLALLAALKHPLAASGLDPGAFRARVRALEIAVLRGPRPAPGFEGLLAALQAADDRGGWIETAGSRRDLVEWVEGLAALARDFSRALSDSAAGLAEVVDRHVAFAERLAASDRQSGAERLWAQDAGEAAARFVSELVEDAAMGPPLAGERYPAFLASIMAGSVVRPRYGRHPRLAILGPLEARLQRAEVMILSGLNEGTWPAEPDSGPWLSRPMRSDLALPAPERRIGLAAHDFAQAFAAPRVYLTRATRVEGAPSVPSRWLLRLDALLRALDLEGTLEKGGDQWLAWAAALDVPGEQRQPGPPAPTPPLAARPRRLSVTDVETWMRDPYGLYAKRVLGLRALEPIDADPGGAQRGTLIHGALEGFVRAHPERLPDDPEGELLRHGEQVFAALRARPAVWAFWWPRFLRIATWFAAQEREERRGMRRAWAEVEGRLALEAPGGQFLLTAKADRVELLEDESLVLVDYKTGTVPNASAVGLGFAPQLPLEAAIATAGGFSGILAGPVARLEHWRLTGGDPAGETLPLKGDPAALAQQAINGLANLVALFDDPATPYRALPRPDWAPAYNDYAHLARSLEWSGGAGDGEAGP